MLISQILLNVSMTKIGGGSWRSDKEGFLEEEKHKCGGLDFPERSTAI